MKLPGEDTAGNPTRGPILVERDKVRIILGVISSAVAQAVKAAHGHTEKKQSS